MFLILNVVWIIFLVVYMLKFKNLGIEISICGRIVLIGILNDLFLRNIFYILDMINIY